jgi:serine O-acetyltransferase
VQMGSMLYHIGVNVDKLQLLLQEQIKAGLCFESPALDIGCDKIKSISYDKTLAFIKQLPEIRELLYTDVVAAYNGDPLPKAMVKLFSAIPVFVLLAATALPTLC